MSDEQRHEDEQVEDLDVSGEEAEDVKGGTVLGLNTGGNVAWKSGGQQSKQLGQLPAVQTPWK